MIAGLMPLAYGTVGKLVALTSKKGDAIKREWSLRLRDLDEFLPPGFLTYSSYRDFEADRDDNDPRFSATVSRRLAVLRTRPMAEIEGVPLSSAVALADGSIRLQFQATSPARVVVRRFHFPSWTATTADGRVLPTEPFGPDRLVSFVAAPGTDYRVAVTLLPVERLGWAITGVSALLTAMAGLIVARRRAESRAGLRRS